MNKLIIVVLNIVLAIVLIPIVILFTNNAKNDLVSLSFDVTYTDGIITSNLTDNQLTTVINNFDDIETISSFNFSTDVPFEILQTTSYTVYDIAGKLPDDELLHIKAGDIILFTWDENLYTSTSNASRYQNWYSSATQTNLWGFSVMNWTGKKVDLLYNNTFLTLVTSTGFNDTPYSDSWIEWIPDPTTETGIIKILQDWSEPIGYAYVKSETLSTDPIAITGYGSVDPTDFFTLVDGYVTTSNTSHTSSDPIIKTESEVVTWGFDPLDLLTNEYTIRAGDYITYNKFAIRNNVTYSEYVVRSDMTDTMLYPTISLSGNGVFFNYDSAGSPTSFSLEGGTWDNPTLGANTSNNLFTWEVTGDTGTLTFLQDLPSTYGSIRISNSLSTPQYYWVNSTNLSTQAILHMTIPVSTLEFNYGENSLYINAETGSITSNAIIPNGTQTVTMDIVITSDGVLSNLIDILPILFVIATISLMGYAFKKRF